MANYLEQYNYQPIAPANTNIEQIAKTYQSKLAYWEQGASQVKSAYQNYLGLDLTRQDNQQALSEYMQNAKQQLKQTSLSDVSIGENVASALGVFDGLTDGKTSFSRNILGDHMITDFYKDEISKGESLKSGDNASQYFDKNVTYLKQKLQDFSQAKDPSAWQQFYATRKGYSPYYDVSKEITSLLKDFDPSSIITSNAKDGYIYKSKDMNTLPDDVQRYLSSRLSDKAKRQIEIEGSVNFYGNEGVLKSSYLNNAAEELSALKEKQENTQRKIALSNKSDGEALKSLYSQIGNEIEEKNAYIKQMSDNDFFIKNRDHYAGQVQQAMMLKNIGIGMTRVEHEATLSPDTVWMQNSSQVFQHNMKILDYQHTDIESEKDRQMKLEIARINNSPSGTAGTAGTGNNAYSDNSKTLEVPVKSANGTYVVSDPLDQASKNLDSSMLQFTQNNPQFQKAFDAATTQDDKIKVFNSFMAVKQKDVEKADTDLETWKTANPQATPQQIDDRRKSLYTLNRVNDLMDYKDKLETYTLTKTAREQREGKVIDSALSNITENPVVDISGNKGNLYIRKDQYANIIKGKSSLLQFHNVTINGHAVSITSEQKQQIMHEAAIARVHDRNLTSEEAISKGMQKVLADVDSVDADRAAKIFDNAKGTGGFPAQYKELDPTSFKIFAKSYPTIANTAVQQNGNYYVPTKGNLGLTGLKKSGDVSFDTYIDGHKIDVSDNTQWLYKRFDAGLDAMPTNPKADRQTAIQVTNKELLTRLREQHNTKEKAYENFYSLPNGTVFGTYVGKDKNIEQDVVENNTNYSFTPQNVLLPKYQALNSFFTESIDPRQGVVFSPPVTNSKNEQFRIAFSNKNDGNYYNVEKYLPSSTYADKDGWISVSHNQLTNMEQVQHIIEGK